MLNLKGKEVYTRKDAHIKFHSVVKTPLARKFTNSRPLGAIELHFTDNEKAQNQFVNQILNSISPTAFDRIFPHLEPAVLMSGENIYEPSDSQQRFVYFPETAVISNYQVLADGNTTEIAMVGKEGAAGFTSVFSQQIAPHWTQVAVGGTALRIKAEILHEEFSRCGSLQEQIFNYTANYIRQISQRIICCVHHLTEARFCCWLLMVQDRAGSPKLPLTQDQVARYLGVHRPCITHIAQQLRENEIIDYVRGNITILNRAELEKLACECYLLI